MQVRTTKNPAHQLVVKKAFDWTPYEGTVFTGGNYSIQENWLLGLGPVRKDKETWLVPKITNWEAWTDGNRQFRVEGLAGAGAWSEGFYKEALFLTYGYTRGAVAAQPPFDVPMKVEWIDIEYQATSWNSGVEPADTIPFPSSNPTELSAERDLELLVVHQLAVGFYQEQQVGFLAPSPDPPIGFRLASGKVWVNLTYEWLTVDNLTLWKLQKEANPSGTL